MGHPLKIAPDGPVIVIGAVNMDLSGTPAAALRDGDSNPGRVTMTPGGVARNIAENLARLGRKVSLITAMGDDLYAAFIRERSLNSGIDLSLIPSFAARSVNSDRLANGSRILFPGTLESGDFQKVT